MLHGLDPCAGAKLLAAPALPDLNNPRRRTLAPAQGPSRPPKAPLARLPFSAPCAGARAATAPRKPLFDYKAHATLRQSHPAKLTTRRRAADAQRGTGTTGQNSGVFTGQNPRLWSVVSSVFGRAKHARNRGRCGAASPMCCTLSGTKLRVLR